jgi:hypothetical protein
MKDLSSKEALEKLFKWRDSHITLRLTVIGRTLGEKYTGHVFVAPNTVDSRIALGAGWLDKALGFDLIDAVVIKGGDDLLDIITSSARYLLEVVEPF